MSPPVERVLEALRRAGSRGRGATWQCPAHDDRRPSLSVRQARDGRVLLRCHAGCELAEVLRALTLQERDLFPEPAPGLRAKPGRPRWVASYPYVDARGRLLFEVLRYEPKLFRVRRPGPDGWRWGLGDTQRVLFRLPQVLAAARAGQTVFVVEGEKDVLALEALGKVATTNPGGAGRWRAEYAQALRGAHAVVIADRDEPGRRHALAVARSLQGVAASVKLCEPPEGFRDVSELLQRGPGLEALEPLQGAEAEPGPPGLTVAQQRRFAFVTVAGWAALPERSAKAFALAACLGRMQRSDGTFNTIRRAEEAACVVVRRTQRDRVLQLLPYEDRDRLRPWRRAVADWQAAAMAHQCKPDELALFFAPADKCPACKAAIPQPAKFGGRSRQFWRESRLKGGMYTRAVPTAIERDSIDSRGARARSSQRSNTQGGARALKDGQQ